MQQNNKEDKEYHTNFVRFQLSDRLGSFTD